MHYTVYCTIRTRAQLARKQHRKRTTEKSEKGLIRILLRWSEKDDLIKRKENRFKGYTYATCSKGNFSGGFENMVYQTNKHKYC